MKLIWLVIINTLVIMKLLFCSTLSLCQPPPTLDMDLKRLTREQFHRHCHREYISICYAAPAMPYRLAAVRHLSSEKVSAVFFCTIHTPRGSFTGRGWPCADLARVFMVVSGSPAVSLFSRYHLPSPGLFFNDYLRFSVWYIFSLLTVCTTYVPVCRSVILE